MNKIYYLEATSNIVHIFLILFGKSHILIFISSKQASNATLDALNTERKNYKDFSASFCIPNFLNRNDGAELDKTI